MIIECLGPKRWSSVLFLWCWRWRGVDFTHHTLQWLILLIHTYINLQQIWVFCHICQISDALIEGFFHCSGDVDRMVGGLLRAHRCLYWKKGCSRRLLFWIMANLVWWKKPNGKVGSKKPSPQNRISVIRCFSSNQFWFGVRCVCYAATEVRICHHTAWMRIKKQPLINLKRRCFKKHPETPTLFPGQKKCWKCRA